MTFDEAKTSRDGQGRFAAHLGEPPEVNLRLADNEFRESPLSEEDINRFTGGDCNHLAQRLYERLGWEPVIITTDGTGWTHVGVRSPEGTVLDASGISDGSHILNDDRYYDAFSDEELEDADDVVLAPMPEGERAFIAEEYAAFEDRETVERVADELITWLDSESEVR